MSVTVLAVDLGSSSGRIVAGTFHEGRIDEVEVRRFPHEARLVDGYLSWDLDYIGDEVIAGLRDAVRMFPDAISVSVDTWGVDHVALGADGEPVTPGRAYRDERTNRTLPAYTARLDEETAWAATGIAPAVINTSNQLFAFIAEEPEAAARTERVLFLADYFTYLLSGRLGWSRSPASTSGLCVPGADAFSDEVMEALGIPRNWFGDPAPEHVVAGPCVVEGLESLTVVRAGGHDTACAVHALQRDLDRDAYFLSCGSWSVLGVLRDDPLLSPEARALGLSNEAQADAGLRPLFNLTGMWILQECQRQWRAEGRTDNIVELIRLAEAAPSTGVTIDTDDPRFVAPGGMVDRIRAALKETGVEGDLTEGGIVRVVLESLASRYSRAIDALNELTGVQVPQLNLVGGGSRNALLCQLTADALGIPVVAGPVEASVLGSMLAQLEVMGSLDPVDRNAVIGASASTVTYRPRR
ncbi:rhamnulokinase [Tessaracoccus sp. HDW20]|uniref:rhamnulokinase n=1 Tax=Tessaracoccus coleopterorum TaxID=2714950 RepID=UPI0018D2B9D5|nr:rhamnulokinase [Tessaracoccus coleopterorum]